MIISSEVQKKMEARVAALGMAFLLSLKVEYIGIINGLYLFYDALSEHLIGIEDERLSKDILIDNLNILRRVQ